jgi:hypothetical protein
MVTLLTKQNEIKHSDELGMIRSFCDEWNFEGRSV